MILLLNSINGDFIHFKTSAMKKAILLIFFVFISKLNQAQNWCAPGAEWHYRINNTMFPYMPSYADGYLKVNLSSTSTVGGNVYFQLTGTYYGQINTAYSPTTTLSSYFQATLTVQNQVVYITFPGYAVYDTLVNFNAGIGDKWLKSRGDHNIGSCFLNVPRPSVTVADTGHVLINGNSLKYIDLTDGERIIDKIGGIHGFMHPYYYCNVDQRGYGAFVCYSDNNFPLYQNPGYNLPCDFTTVGKEEFTLKGLDLNVYPNPASDNIKIDLSGENAPEQFQVQVYDMLGKQLLSGTYSSGSSLYLGYIKEGLYTLQLVSEGNILSSRKLVISE